MIIPNFFTGMFIGMAMSIPFGPIGVLCINRILQRGRIAGLASGLGVALGDSLFASLAVLGVTQVTDFLLRSRHLLELLGGALIMIHGIHHYTRTAKNENIVTDNSGLNLFKDAGSMFLITVANPQTIIGFSAALVGMVRFYHIETTQDALALLSGVFCGSILWWLFISTLLGGMRKRISKNFTERLHRYASLLVAIMGAGLVLHSLYAGELPVIKSAV